MSNISNDIGANLVVARPLIIYDYLTDKNNSRLSKRVLFVLWNF